MFLKQAFLHCSRTLRMPCRSFVLGTSYCCGIIEVVQMCCTVV